MSSSSSNDGGSKEAKILKKVREIIINPFFYTNVLNKVLHSSYDLFFQRKKRKVDIEKIKSRNQQNNQILKKHEEFLEKRTRLDSVSTILKSSEDEEAIEGPGKGRVSVESNDTAPISEGFIDFDADNGW